MTILVCPLAHADALCRDRGATHAVSLLAGAAEPPDFALPAERRLHLRFNDIAQPTEGLVAPNAAHIAALLAFLASWNGRSPLLVHCWAGVSRSTAAAFAAACLREGAGGEPAMAQRLRAAAPFATPNPLIVALADEALGRGGAMVRAIAAIGRGVDTGVGRPFEL
ncbi:MAG TPA: hypothetical protein VL460_07345 [Caulobacteraceae bacterium]|jgi:predicted protein tyrosine phosphatase|nr:hypothetical protein [Caulobacteraceae bacterium]